jgi:hypothetical protein
VTTEVALQAITLGSILGLVILFIGRGSGTDGFLQQDRIDLYHILRRVMIMSQALERLQASVASETSVVASVQTLLTDLAQRVRDANDNDDSDELNTIADEIDQHASQLAAAVTANTPADTIRRWYDARKATDATNDAGTVGGSPVSDPSSSDSGNSSGGTTATQLGGDTSPDAGSGDAQPSTPSE